MARQQETALPFLHSLVFLFALVCSLCIYANVYFLGSTESATWPMITTAEVTNTAAALASCFSPKAASLDSPQTAVEERLSSLLALQKRFAEFKKQKGRFGSERLLSYWIGKSPDMSGNDLMIATHVSANKWDRVFTMLDWWQGPISVSVYCSPTLLEQMDAFWKNLEKQILDVRYRVAWEHYLTVHFYFEKGHDMAFYPHNILRNMALHNARSEFVLALDADFLPAPIQTHRLLIDYVLSNETMVHRMRNQKHAFVLPVFEIYPEVKAKKQENKSSSREGKETGLKFSTLDDQVVGLASADDLPTNVSDLVFMYQHNIARQWHYEPGHEPTNYKNWISFHEEHTLKASGSSSMFESYPVDPTPPYEPYFIAHRPSLPAYWEQFRGYGLDKRSFVNECVFKGFTFHPLRHFWLGHLGHPSNRNVGSIFRNQKIWDLTFVPHLHALYDENTKSRPKLKKFFDTGITAL